MIGGFVANRFDTSPSPALAAVAQTIGLLSLMVLAIAFITAAFPFTE